MRTIHALLLCLAIGCSTERTGVSPLDGSSEHYNAPRRGPAPMPDSRLAVDVDLPADTLTLDATKPSSPTDASQPEVAVDLNTERSVSDTNADLTTIRSPDTAVDTTADLIADLLKPDVSPDLTPDVPPDTQVDLLPDLKRDLATPDLSPNLPLGTACSHNSDCNSTFCTDNVCCQVAKCVDTCVPTTSTCAPYNGFTCAPFGTCRGY